MVNVISPITTCSWISFWTVTFFQDQQKTWVLLGKTTAKLSGFIKNILISISKMNQSLMSLDQHEVK